MDDWESDENGNLRLSRLHSYQSAVAPGHVLFRIAYLQTAFDADGKSRGEEIAQLVIDPKLARQLAQDLIANADRAEERAAEGSDSA